MASGPPGSGQYGYVPYGGGATGAGAAAGVGVTPPTTNPKDCVPGFCTANCPQRCFTFFPPPQPFDFPDDGGDSSSGPTFPQLVIAIIRILGSAFLLIAYYAIISRYYARLE